MRFFLPAILPLLFSCSDKPEDTANSLQTCSATGDTIVGVISTLTHARRENGVGWGLNIDGLSSFNTDPNGCYKEDLVDPNGNRYRQCFLRTDTSLESTEAVALESLVQDYQQR